MKNMKSLIINILCLTSCFCFTSFYSFAGEWVDEYIDPDTGYEVIDGYKYEDGSVVKDSWRWIDDDQDGVYECYFFDSFGNMQKAGTPADSFFIDKEGRYSPGPRYRVKHWEPTDDELNEIWEGMHLDMGDSISRVNAYYYIYDIDEVGFKLEYKHRKYTTQPFETDTYDMKWIENDKMAAVYTEYKHGELVDFMELSIGPDIELDFTYFDNIERFSMVRGNLIDDDNIELTEDGRVKDMI